MASIGNTEVKDALSVKELSFSTSIEGAGTYGPELLNITSNSTTPNIIPDKGDPTTGLSQLSTSTIGLICGGLSSWYAARNSGHCIQTHEAHVGLTADVGSVQGGLPLLSSYNVISISANAGDSCTLPAAFAVGTKITIKNDAAVNAVDVFPASGDDLGAGANTAASLAAGASITYIGTVANSTWTSIGN